MEESKSGRSGKEGVYKPAGRSGEDGAFPVGTIHKTGNSREAEAGTKPGRSRHCRTGHDDGDDAAEGPTSPSLVNWAYNISSFRAPHRHLSMRMDSPSSES